MLISMGVGALESLNSSSIMLFWASTIRADLVTASRSTSLKLGLKHPMASEPCKYTPARSLSNRLRKALTNRETWPRVISGQFFHPYWGMAVVYQRAGRVG